MNKSTDIQPVKSTRFLPPRLSKLQRKCACGNPAYAGGECESCANNRSSFQRKLAVSESNDPLEREADRNADRVMAAPANTGVGGAALHIQRCSGQSNGQKDTAPVSVDRVLASSGRPLESTLRQDMERRFGHDFSQVRVHACTNAEQSARDVNAHAYTVGQNIVFGAGQFAPETDGGRRLLAHELTHVVQQSGLEGMGIGQSNGNRDGSFQSPVRKALQTERLQRQPKTSSSSKDKTAQDIIDKAKDATKTPDIATRAKNAVWDIIKAYYPTEAAKVNDVVYEESETGLNTTSVGTGAKATGTIAVGKYFVEHIDSFARRVLQVGHELQHIDQYRSGTLSGKNKQDEREFLAFEWEASQQPKSGTGRLGDGMRRDLIDCALGYFNCLAEDKRTGYDTKKAALLKLRDTVNGTSGNPKTEPPDACKRCNPEKKKGGGSGGKSSALEQCVDQGKEAGAGENETQVVMNNAVLDEEQVIA